MKKLFFIFAIAFFNTPSFSQSHFDAEKRIWSIDNYSGSAAIIVNPGVVKVQKGDQSQEYAIKDIGGKSELVTIADSTSLLQLLALRPNEINQQFAHAKGNNSAERLINEAKKLKDGKLVIQSPHANAQDKILDTQASTTIEEGGVPATTDAKTDFSKWLLPLIAGIVALLIGYLLGKNTKPKQVVKTVPQPAQMPTTAAIEPTDENEDIKKLKSENKILKEKNTQLVEKTKALIEGDEVYYNGAFSKIILPLQQAIDSGDTAKIAAYMTLASEHFAGITRTKIRKKLKYDDANIQLITGNPTFTDTFTVLGKDTPIDKIPANMRTLISFLQKQGVTGLDDTLVQGYKIKNI